jgi:hypothetical protein
VGAEGGQGLPGAVLSNLLATFHKKYYYHQG